MYLQCGKGIHLPGRPARSSGFPSYTYAAPGTRPLLPRLSTILMPATVRAEGRPVVTLASRLCRRSHEGRRPRHIPRARDAGMRVQRDAGSLASKDNGFHGPSR